MALEHLAYLPGLYWKGQPSGFEHFMESDFFEYDTFASPRSSYVATLHDWYGQFHITCKSQSFCDHRSLYSDGLAALPSTVDFTAYHKYGFLWVPATPTTLGLGQAYFDNQPMGQKFTWTYLQDTQPWTNSDSWKFGIYDKQHMVAILGSGINEPMTVKSLHVWQKSDGWNVRK